MAANSQNHVFISYSHENTLWRNQLGMWLNPLLESTDVIVWSDDNIKASEDWRAEIEAAIGNSFLAVLLVTQEFLNSEFIMENELPLLMKAAAEKRLMLTWIAVEDSTVGRTEITNIQSLNPPNSPIATFDEQARKSEWKKVAEQIREFASDRVQTGPFTTPPAKTDNKPIVIGNAFPRPSTFRNREDETAKLFEFLSTRKIFVYVVGPMGVGKTALVSKFCEQVESGEFKLDSECQAGGADGIVRFTFRTGDTQEIERLYEDLFQLISEKAAQEVNSYWQDKNRDEWDKFAFLLSKLPGKRCLLAIDNFEVALKQNGKISSLSLATFFDVCLQTNGHGLRIVATSREAISIDVQSVEAAHRLPLSKGLPKEEAMQMLRELLNSLDPEGAYGLANPPDEQIEMAVERCDCLPSALQIIAGILRERVFTLSLNDLLKDEDLFKSGLKTMVQEQLEIQSRGNSLVLQALAIFDTPVPPQALAFLLDPYWDKSSSEPISSCLRSLLDSYFVFFDKENKTFQLEPIKRECAYELIPDTDDEYSRKNCHLRAAEYFRSQRKQEDEWKSLDDLQPLMDEFDQFILAKEFSGAAKLLDEIDKDYLSPWGHYRTLASMREKIKKHLVDPALLIENLGRLCAVNRLTGKRQEAIESGEEAVKIAKEKGDKKVIAQWVGELADAYADAGEFPKAVAAYEEACKIAREDEAPQTEAWNLGGLAILFRQSGRVEEALECYNRGIEVALKYSDEEMRGRFVCNRVWAHIAMGDYPAAINDCDESSEMVDQLGLTHEAYTLHHRARALFQRRNFKESKEFNQRALEICVTAQVHRCEAFIRRDIGYSEHHLGELKTAESLYCEAFEFNEIEVSHVCATKLGILFLELDNTNEAEKWFLIAIDRCKRLLKIKDDYEALYQLSISQLAQGDSEEALESYNRALDMSSHCGTLMEAWLDLEILERAAPNTPELEKAKSLISSAAKKQNCRSLRAT